MGPKRKAPVAQPSPKKTMPHIRAFKKYVPPYRPEIDAQDDAPDEDADVERSA